MPESCELLPGCLHSLSTISAALKIQIHSPRGKFNTGIGLHFTDPGFSDLTADLTRFVPSVKWPWLNKVLYK